MKSTIPRPVSCDFMRHVTQAIPFIETYFNIYTTDPDLYLRKTIYNPITPSQIIPENIYGKLKSRFRILRTGINLKLETCQKIVVACACLNNIALDLKEKVP